MDRIEVLRFQDAQYRRVPFQQKIGAGLTLEQFEAKRAAGTLRHVGLNESIQFFAEQLGWKLDETDDQLSPVIAEQQIDWPAMTIAAGDTMGVWQIGRGLINGVEKNPPGLSGGGGEPESYDEVRIYGKPNVISRIQGGVNGDIATCAITLNPFPSVLRALPGLRTMADVQMLTCQL